jgi:hypothetical protein
MMPVTWFRGKRGTTTFPSAWRYAGPASDTSSGSTSLTAAATRASTTSIKRNKPADWWTEAWEMYNQVGELRYVSNAIAGRIGQARLYIEKDGVEVEDEDDEILNLITGQMIERMGLNLFVAGAVWLIGRPDPETDEQIWKVYSTVEVKTQGSGTAKIEDEQYVIEDIYMELITDPHPADWAQVDSPVRSALPVLRELVGLTQHVSAQVDSRLSGAGVYWIPNSILANPTVPLVRDAQSQTFSDNPVLNAVMSAMLLPIEDRSNASAIVPLLLGAPDESIAKIRYDTFATPFDRNTQALREEAIRRLALCLDSPPELLLGTSDQNHWSAWLVRDEVVQAHIVPRLDLICDALTTGFYRPMRAQVNPGEDVSVYEVKADVSVLVQRPNRLADASTLHAAHVIGDAALREAGGFGDEDAPTTLDTAIRLTLETALGNPQLLDNMSEVFANIAALLDGTPLTGPNQEEEPPAAPVRALRPVQQPKEVSVADVDTLPAAGPPV